MTKIKTFAVVVVWEQGGNLYVQAKDAIEARKIASGLMETNSSAATIEPDSFLDGEYKISDIEELKEPEQLHLDNAAANDGAIKDLDEFSGRCEQVGCYNSSLLHLAWCMEHAHNRSKAETGF